MRLYLVQHGEAVEKEINPDRPLSPKGSKQVQTVVNFLKPAGVPPPEIWHSGKARAHETAEIFAKHLPSKAKVKKVEGLNPQDPVADIAKKLRDRERDLMIVGHLPHLSELAALLLTGAQKGEPVAFERGGVLCLEQTEPGQWSVRWMVVPSLLGA
ncbi:MAG: phosphohistidine phosphatase SixA [Candidatus Hydrogenedentes bacterium]|nr:phosphohistidine phosphatase SixA [Candidatus Hydrogenedentota bacterium]